MINYNGDEASRGPSVTSELYWLDGGACRNSSCIERTVPRARRCCIARRDNYLSLSSSDCRHSLSRVGGLA